MGSSAALLALLLLVPAAGAIGAHVGELGAFTGHGVLQLYANGNSHGECVAAFAIASEPDGGWTITGIRTYAPVVQYCTAWCCGQVAWYPGAVDARGSPGTGFAGESDLLGVRNVVEVGPLSSATPFRLDQTTSTSTTQWTLVGTLDFSPTL